MMLDGVAENHTAAMLEPYLDADGCAGDVDGLDFIDPQDLPGSSRLWTARASRCISTPSATERSATPSTR